MKPVDMIVKHDPANGQWGDCTRACIASIFELPAEEVPHFCAGGDEPVGENGMLPWEQRLRAWLAERGFNIVWFKVQDQTEADNWDERSLQFHHMRGGPGPRGVGHDTVWFGHRMVHDPHPTDKAGIAFPQDWGFFVKAQPMLLNFHKQFAFPVYNGEKRQTIRAAGKRKDVPAIGGTAHCYTGLRTTKTQRLGSWPIAQVDVIRMDIGASAIANVNVAGDPLTRLQLTALAGKDGFRSWEDMERWFIQAHGPQEFYGWVVGWVWTPSDAPVPVVKP